MNGSVDTEGSAIKGSTEPEESPEAKHDRALAEFRVQNDALLEAMQTPKVQSALCRMFEPNADE